MNSQEQILIDDNMLKQYIHLSQDNDRYNEGKMSA